jgi:acetyl-CoA C-acetyltransferase
MSEALILDVVRTPRGKGRPDGGLHGIHPQALFAQCLQALRERVGFDAADVDDVVAGNGILAGDTVTTSHAFRCCWPDGRNRCRA